MMTGKGEKKFDSGDFYLGEFFLDKKHGKGVHF
jgi:hypothetical protein